MSFFRHHMGILYLGRISIGLAIGVTSLNVPIYISEIVPNEVRGRFVAWFTFLSVLGVLTANVVTLILKDQFFMIFWIGEVLVMAQIFAVWFKMPESPRWLAKNG